MKRERDNEHGGDGVQWYRGEMIGKGSFGSVYLGELKNPKAKFRCFPQSMAVKSAEVSLSGSIQKEREALQNIGGCRYIIKCFGDEITTGDNGEMVYNLLLEYGSGGNLADLIKKSNGLGLPERDVRYYSRSILRGLNHIHECGFVHCDLKPENILLVSDCGSAGSKFRAKIGDFGLAKRATKNKNRKLEHYWRGTPTYLSPEVVMDGVQEAPSDIWAFGCIAVEMLTGKPAWGPSNDVDPEVVLDRIGKNGELPKIPDDVSREGREFLKGCFSRNPMFRLTADMLLNHKFLEGLVDDLDEKVEEVDIGDEDDIYTDELGLSFVVYETDEECDYSSFPDDDCSLISYSNNDEIYAFDTDGIWSDEETVDPTSKGSAFDRGVVNAKNEVSTKTIAQNPVIPFTVQAGV